MIVLGIDPGREKCGLAVVSPNLVLVKRVVARGEFLDLAREYIRQYNVARIVLGDGTGSKDFLQEIEGVLPVVTVDEQYTTEEARKRYWLDHRPKGWRRFLPTSMQVPPEPFDDYVAVILAERYLSEI
ncbi:MAG: Holliday junction resolvase RuvX [Bacillota bacterium]|nr:Holliday junction resolvase RuvX [Bacillota bacterium]